MDLRPWRCMSRQCEHPGKFPDANNAATGLALMCFLGAGQTHMEGEYKEVVLAGLTYLCCAS